MAIVFKTLVQNTQIRYFWSQIQVFLFLHKTLQLGKFKGADFKCDNNSFEILAQKYPNQAFWSQIQTFLFFREILQLDKFEVGNFKYNNIFFKIPGKIHESGIFGPKFRQFCFFVKFCKQTNLRVLTSNMIIAFLKLLPNNTQIRHLWSKILRNCPFGPKLGHFCFFREILQLDKLEGADLKCDKIFFKMFV